MIVCRIIISLSFKLHKSTYLPNPDISRVWFVHGQDIRGAAVVLYRNPLITQHMDEPGSLKRVKIKWLRILKPKVQTVFFIWR